jgi:aryl-alcohol dehydrogenase-like predicted oxidoreductase
MNSPWSKPGGNRIVLGGRFGEEPERDTHRRLDVFVEAGGRLVDTAHSYADGEAERVLGRWLRARGRDRLAVVDKVCHPRDGRTDARPATIEAEIGVSLRRLRAEHLDVVLLHRDDPAVPVDDIAAALVNEVERGRVRWIGVSNWPFQRLRRFFALLGDTVDTPVVSYQRSLAVPAREIWAGALTIPDPWFDALHREGVPLLAWAAQARGWFAFHDDPINGSPFDTAHNIEVRRVAAEIARAHGVRPTVVALNWLLRHPLTWPIVGPQNLAELTECLDATGLLLTPQEVDALDSARQRVDV